MEYDYYLKYQIVGNRGVGKSSLLLKYTQDSFFHSYIPTIGEDYKIRTIKVGDNKTVKQIICDTPSERFKTISSDHYRGVHASFIVFDICDRKSFLDVPNWFTEITNNTSDNIPIIIVGNKSDLDNREVLHEEAKSLADRYGIVYFEVSAKEDCGNNSVEEIFHYAASQILNKQTDKPIVNDYVDIRYFQSSEYLFTFLINGASKVGKSSYRGQILSNSKTKIRDGSSVYKTLLVDSHNNQISIQTVDYLNNKKDIPDIVDGIIMIFDITNKSSLQYLLELYKDNTQYTQLIQNGKSSILIGNKCDLEFKREVSFEDAIKVADQLKCKYLETSTIKELNNFESGIYQSIFEITNQLINNKIQNSITLDNIIINNNSTKIIINYINYNQINSFYVK